MDGLKECNLSMGGGESLKNGRNFCCCWDIISPLKNVSNDSHLLPLSKGEDIGGSHTLKTLEFLVSMVYYHSLHCLQHKKVIRIQAALKKRVPSKMINNHCYVCIVVYRM